MPLNFIIPALMQIIGLLIAAAVVIVEWGAIGFFGWLAVVLYLAGREMTPEAPEEPDTAQARGQ